MPSPLKLFSSLYLNQARMTRRTPPVEPMMRREAKFWRMLPSMGREKTSQQGDIGPTEPHRHSEVR